MIVSAFIVCVAKKRVVNKSIANKNKLKKAAKKKDKILEKEVEIKKEKLNKKENFSKIVYKKQEDVFDVCTILEKCSIDEISKYLLEQGRKKDYPDITKRQ